MTLPQVCDADIDTDSDILLEKGLLCTYIQYIYISSLGSTCVGVNSKHNALGSHDISNALLEDQSD